MPMSEAVEGYDLFDKMKVQKGMALIGPSRKTSFNVLTYHSDIRSSEVANRKEICSCNRESQMSS